MRPRRAHWTTHARPRRPWQRAHLSGHPFSPLLHALFIRRRRNAHRNAAGGAGAAAPAWAPPPPRPKPLAAPAPVCSSIRPHFPRSLRQFCAARRRRSIAASPQAPHAAAFWRNAYFSSFCVLASLRQICPWAMGTFWRGARARPGTRTNAPRGRAGDWVRAFPGLCRPRARAPAVGCSHAHACGGTPAAEGSTRHRAAATRADRYGSFCVWILGARGGRRGRAPFGYLQEDGRGHAAGRGRNVKEERSAPRRVSRRAGAARRRAACTPALRAVGARVAQRRVCFRACGCHWGRRRQADAGGAGGETRPGDARSDGRRQARFAGANPSTRTREAIVRPEAFEGDAAGCAPGPLRSVQLASARAAWISRSLCASLRRCARWDRVRRWRDARARLAGAMHAVRGCVPVRRGVCGRGAAARGCLCHVACRIRASAHGLAGRSAMGPVGNAKASLTRPPAQRPSVAGVSARPDAGDVANGSCRQVGML